jgi:hypothetical protein
LQVFDAVPIQVDDVASVGAGHHISAGIILTQSDGLSLTITRLEENIPIFAIINIITLGLCP